MHSLGGTIKTIFIFLLVLLVLALWFQYDATTTIVGNAIRAVGLN